jgi:hypothetical protein
MGVGMKILSAAETQKTIIENLRLEADIFDLETPETIAASIRRAASFLCPCSSSQLIQSVFQLQKYLVEDIDAFKGHVADILESLIAYGDLIEESDAITNISERRGRILYLRPPSFVWRENRSALLLGVAPDDVSVIPTELEKRVDYRNHTRRLTQKADEDLQGDLKKFGLTEIQIDVWNRKNAIPVTETATAHVQKLKGFLKGNPGILEDLQILNPQKFNVRYYSRRWESLKKQTGFFVARRPQVYGNDLWCYVELETGKPVKMIDFPVIDIQSPGRDEAWRLQMAIDAVQNGAQVFTTEELSNSNSRIKFYSPIPTWAKRRLDNLGEPVVKNDCLFSYKLSSNDLPQEIKFLEEKLWLVHEI